MTFITRCFKSLSARTGLRIGMGIAMGAFAATAHAMVPASERAVLDAIWFGTGGQLPGGTDSTWINRGGWGLPVFLGISECGSYGVTCVVDQGQEHISAIELDGNGLTGQLPPSLSDLPYLETFSAGGNDVSGSIPELLGLTRLVYFSLDDNQLTGAIPELSGLTKLAYFSVDSNQLIGAIPPLTGLASLEYVDVGQNQLSGNIPSLAGLTSLQSFVVYYNHLTGPIPSFAGLANLHLFFSTKNQLTGPLPALTNMTSLVYFDVSANKLEGTIPSLAGLPNLVWFDVGNNNLGGPLPALSDLTSMQLFVVGGNQLTGLVPAAPPNGSQAQLCPNRFTIVSQPTIDPAWDAATGNTPWWATPFATNSCDELFYGDFEYPGGGP
jgi:hypothetical protein